MNLNKSLILTITLAILAATFLNKVNAVGIPPFDLSGTYTVSLTDVDLINGQVVNLVSLNESRCRYIGKTQADREGAVAILIERKLCGDLLEEIKAKPFALIKPHKAGDKLFIPIDGIVHELENFLDKAQAIEDETK